MTFPTIEAAAARLGAHQSALIHQFRRLERDIGAKLYHRSVPGRPMRPTARGAALLEALSQPAVRAIAPPQQAPHARQPPFPRSRQTARAGSERTTMSPGIQYNRDLSAELASLITSHSAEWVTEQQPIDWRPATWKNHWRTHQLPHPQVLDELQEEYTGHGTIRRSFVFTYQDRSPVELFIAAMAWGLGPDNRGPAKVGKILDRSDAAEAIEAVVNTVRREGAAAGYSKYYSGHRLPQLDVAFITKVLHFAGYQQQHRPRPLIYDNLAATAAIRLPEAPLLPSIREKVSASAYERYCRWAEKTAADHGTEPAVLEWALFRLGRQIRDELRA